MQLEERIKTHFQLLSKGQKKVAMYLVNHPQEVALFSAQEMGGKIGVSETTVIRFCHRIGVSGYAALQKMVRAQLVGKGNSTAFKQHTDLEPHFYEKVMEQDRMAIKETLAQLNEKDYGFAVDRICNAETVYVLGLRSSYPAANWLAFTLGLVKGTIRLMKTETEDVIQSVSQMDEKSVVIVISFHRYLKETIRIAELAKGQGATIIGITDSVVAPLHVHSDVLFPIYSPEKSTIGATAALFSFMHALVAGISDKEKDSFEKRQEIYQSVASDFLFVEGVDSK